MNHPASTEMGIALLRISLGAMWLVHALLKLPLFTLPGTAGYFESIGFPGLLAYPVLAVELVGGIALLHAAGTTRPAACTRPRWPWRATSATATSKGWP
jgi:uncharacterized membrane protein YphA (DoxX/SURF4 family)